MRNFSRKDPYDCTVYYIYILCLHNNRTHCLFCSYQDFPFAPQLQVSLSLSLSLSNYALLLILFLIRVGVKFCLIFKNYFSLLCLYSIYIFLSLLCAQVVNWVSLFFCLCFCFWGVIECPFMEFDMHDKLITLFWLFLSRFQNL